MNLNPLLDHQHCIIYGEGDKRKLNNEIVHLYPNCKVEMSKTFSSEKKAGPFTLKVKKTMYELLMADKAIKSMDDSVQYLDQAMRVLGLTAIKDRYPSNLNPVQKERFSLILDVAQGKKEYLFYKEGFNYDLAQHILYLKWFQTLSNDYKFIFITNETEDNVIMALKENKLESACTLLEYKGKELTLKNPFDIATIEKEVDYYNADMKINQDGLWMMNLVLPKKDILNFEYNRNKFIKLINEYEYDNFYFMDADSNRFYLDDVESINKLVQTPHKNFILRLDSTFPCIVAKHILEFFEYNHIISEQQYKAYRSQLSPFLANEFAYITEETLSIACVLNDKEKKEFIEAYKENAKMYEQPLDKSVLEELANTDINTETVIKPDIEKVIKAELEEEFNKRMNDLYMDLESESSDDMIEDEEIVVNEDDLETIHVCWLELFSEGQSFINIDTDEEIYVLNKCISFDISELERGVIYKLLLLNNEPYKLMVCDDDFS